MIGMVLITTATVVLNAADAGQKAAGRAAHSWSVTQWRGGVSRSRSDPAANVDFKITSVAQPTTDGHVGANLPLASDNTTQAAPPWSVDP